MKAPSEADLAALRRISGFYPTPATVIEMMLARLAPLGRGQCGPWSLQPAAATSPTGYARTSVR